MKDKMLQWYLSYMMNLHQRPLLTKSLTACSLGFVEEFTAQSITFPNGKNYIWQRMLKLAAYGALVGAPISHYAYLLLNKLIKGKGWKVDLQKMVVANAAILPVQTAAYLVSVGYINKNSWRAAKDTLREAFLPIMKTSWAAFPLIQFLIFSYLNEALWVPAFNVIGLIFGIFTNVLAKKDDDKLE